MNILFKTSMEGDGLDWTHPDLISALAADSINGICGFQCDSPQLQERPPCMYLGQPFLAVANKASGFPSYEIREEVFMDSLHQELVNLGIPTNHVWLTDYLGRNFLTIHTCEYLRIPDIINAVLYVDGGRYKFLTHGTPGGWKAQFMPGDVFSRRSFEEKLLESLQLNFNIMHDCTAPRFPRNPQLAMAKTWESIGEMSSLRAFLKHWNYATDAGRHFCTRLREILKKKRPVSKFQDRMTWPKYCETARKYGILHCGGWTQYEPQGIEMPVKRHKVQQEEQECMICLVAPPTTMVLPCEHRVVCDECSRSLRATPDNRICVQCRRPITHVAYEQENLMEEK